MIQRKALREDVHREIQSRIVDGRLPAGRRINESHLAADLGISRTPLREAMLTLAAAGFLDTRLGHGFLVPALDPREFRDIQGVLGHLEPFALVLAHNPTPSVLMEISNLLGRAAMRPGADQAVPLSSLSGSVATKLLETVPNRILTRDILRLESLSCRYWRVAITRGLEIPPILDSLGEIYECLRQGRLPAAAELWAHHIEAAADQAVARLTTSQFES